MFRFGSIILAGGLLAAPAQAAVMQAVYTGVEIYRLQQDWGQNGQGVPFVNADEYNYDYAGTPVTWVLRYEIGEPDNHYIWENETYQYDYQSFHWPAADAIKYSELIRGDTVVHQSISAGYVSTMYLTRERNITTEWATENYAHRYSASLDRPNGEWDEHSISSYAWVNSSGSFLPDDFTQPFSIVFVSGEEFHDAIFGEFSSSKYRTLYDSEGNYDGYQQVYDNFPWYITSLTVTRLDTEPSIPAVPLPASAPLLLAALGGLAALRRRKRV
ncbi:VPLPA-CTERM sorting domain-containing protein [Paenirhodobacter populi]|uniref:VPLPA-CTERM sorting domain-containing protein n=1 Tax=Paenirhodobacter populi TaxID=2306993 RepID=A0A443JPY5_9RHOB|nr:VPLPA-CTERM sorting domain-containing protein [Sinirhodobacter populi]RWR22572.1 VPLPA-CTERM sorting domain-containing protein [Sinirhodobacter populi]